MQLVLACLFACLLVCKGKNCLISGMHPGNSLYNCCGLVPVIILSLTISDVFYFFVGGCNAYSSASSSVANSSSSFTNSCDVVLWASSCSSMYF